MPVQQTKLVVAAEDVHTRLLDFRVKKQDIALVALSALAARNDSVADDPKTARGLFAYIYGVRGMRQAFMHAGYERVSRQNIESIYDIVGKRKVMFQTVDFACIESHTPQPISDIGAGKETVIESSYPYLFEEMQRDEDQRRQALEEYDRADVWYICVSFANDSVACELSRPLGVVDKQFSGFKERIFILRDGEGGPAGLINLDDDGPDIDIKPVVLKR
jgi:hypothetical protein